MKVYKNIINLQINSRRSSQLFLLFLLFLLFQKKSLLLYLKHLCYLLYLLFCSLHWLLFHQLSSIYYYSVFRVFILMMYLLHLIQWNLHCLFNISLWILSCWLHSAISIILHFLTFNHCLLFLLSLMTTWKHTFHTHMLSLWTTSLNLLHISRLQTCLYAISEKKLWRRKYTHLSIIICEMWWLIHRISMFYKADEYTRLNTVLTVRLLTIRLAELLRNISSSLMLITIRHLS